MLVAKIDLQTPSPSMGEGWGGGEKGSERQFSVFYEVIAKESNRSRKKLITLP